MNKLLIKAYARKIIEFLIYRQGYKTPEHAYVRVKENPKKNAYDDKFQR